MQRKLPILVSSDKDQMRVMKVPQWVPWSNRQRVQRAVHTSIAGVTTAWSTTCRVECRASQNRVSWWIPKKAWSTACANRIYTTKGKWDMRCEFEYSNRKIRDKQAPINNRQIGRQSGVGIKQILVNMRTSSRIWKVKYNFWNKNIHEREFESASRTTCYRGRTGHGWSRTYVIRTNIV